MPSLVIPNRQVAQPQGPAQVDWSNPITDSLRSLVTVSGNAVVDLVDGVPAVPSGGVNIRAGRHGMAGNAGSTATAGFTASFPAFDPEDKGITIFALWQVNTSSASWKAVAVSGPVALWAQDGAGALTLKSSRVDNAASTYYGYGAAAVVNVPNFTAFAASPTDRKGDIFHNGAWTQPGDGNPGFNGTCSSLIICGNANWAPLNGQVFIAGVFSRKLSQGEILSLYANPWQLIRPTPRRFYFADTGGSVLSRTFSVSAGATVNFGQGSLASQSFSSAGSATPNLAAASLVGRTFSAAGVASPSFTQGSLVGRALASSGIAAAAFSTGASGSATWSSPGTATVSFGSGALAGQSITVAGSSTASLASAALVGRTLTSSGSATSSFAAPASSARTFSISGVGAAHFITQKSLQQALAEIRYVRGLRPPIPDSLGGYVDEELQKLQETIDKLLAVIGTYG